MAAKREREALTDDGYEAVINKLDWTLSKFITGDDRAETVHDLFDINQ